MTRRPYERHLLTVTLAAALAGLIAPWGLAEDELAGAARPITNQTDNPPKLTNDYKRYGQYAVKRMALGEFAEARRYLLEMTAALPDDDDLYLLLAVAQANLGQREAAEASLAKALELGLPPGRVLAGPRGLHEPLRELDTYRKVQEQHAVVPLHGPMVGNVTDRSASVWVRTARPARVDVAYRPASGSAPWRISTASETTRDRDFTAIVPLGDLQPDTPFEYRVRLDGQESDATDTFRTFPAAGQGAKFSLAFGGGAGYHPPQERVWNTIRKRQPLAVLLLGDNIYSDDPETPEVQQYSYYRRQSRPEFRRLVASTAVFAIWDDHDFSTDDSWGGPSVDEPAWKLPVWNVFRQNWVNPAYGGGDEQPGVWYDFSIGDVDFFMLDGRYYRTDSGRRGGSGVDRPTMLGPVQKRWLKDKLRASEATFKVIVSPVPWDFRAKQGAGGLDTWRGFAEERAEIFSFLSRHAIAGVVLMSADRHRSDAWRIERDDDYDLYEFNSSRLTNDHVHPTMPAAIFSYNEKQSFGWVTFDTTSDDPQVTYDVISIDDEEVASVTICRSQLESGDESSAE